MKKLLAVSLSMILAIGVLAGCGNNDNNNNNTPNNAPNQNTEATPTPTATPTPANNNTEAGEFQDGVYYAEAADFASSGWKEVVAFTVENGNITTVNWNGLHKDGGLDKKTYAEQGKYGMINAGAQAEWHEQAYAAEQYLLEVQDPAAIVYDEGGYTDAISGVSIHVNGFVDLVNAALEAGPVEPGPYKDGTYYAEADGDSNWNDNVTITVMAGNIVAVEWNALNADGVEKKTASKEGSYGMVEKGGAQAEWHEQAYEAEQYLLEVQDPEAIVYDEGGYTDAISGVSIHVDGFAQLAIKALEGAK